MDQLNYPELQVGLLNTARVQQLELEWQLEYELKEVL